MLELKNSVSRDFRRAIGKTWTMLTCGDVSQMPEFHFFDCFALCFNIKQWQSWALQTKIIPVDFGRTEVHTHYFWKCLLLSLFFFFSIKNLYYLNTNSFQIHISFTLLSAYLEKYHLVTDVVKWLVQSKNPMWLFSFQFYWICYFLHQLVDSIRYVGTKRLSPD